MRLNIAHQRYFDGSGGHALAAREEGLPHDSVCARAVEKHLKRRAGQQVLNLGVVTGETIATLGEAGAVIHVHDLVTPVSRRMGTAHASGEHIGIRDLFKRFSFQNKSLSVVLLWELLDLIPRKEGRWVVETVTRWLAPKGLLLATFHDQPAETLSRFRMLPGGTMRVDPAAPLPVPARAINNSEAITLLAGLTMVHSAQTRSRIREVVAQRPTG